MPTYDEVQTALHRLVCSAWGYDKSIVRELALRAAPRDKELAERVLAAEAEAHTVSRCSDVHDLPERIN